MHEKTEQYKDWRLKVLEQGNHCCAKCKSRKRLHCHHLKSWADFPELRYDVSNGEVLCRNCHIEVHPFMVKYYPIKKHLPKNKPKKLTKKQKIARLILKAERKAYYLKENKKSTHYLRQARKSLNTLPSGKYDF